MESFREVFMSKNAENYIRTFTEGDNLIYLYGLKHNIIGGFNPNRNNFEDFMDNLPENMQINGFGYIYNENVYEDFDNLIDEQMEKFNNTTKISDTLFAFVIKDVKYLDDFEPLSFEKSVIKNFEDIKNENEANVKSDYSLNKFTTTFLLLNADIKVEFYDEKNFPSEKSKDPNSITIFYKNYKDQITDIFSQNNFFAYLENEKNLFEKIKNFGDNDIKKLNEAMRKLEVNSNISDNVKLIFCNIK